MYDDIARLASSICGTPTALVSLVDGNRQWFKARVGFAAAQTPREHAICDHAIRTPDQLLEIQDLSRDPRFADNPLVDQGDARFYAGMPLVTSGGAALGTVCVLDRRPRALDDDQREALRALARLTMHLLDSSARERLATNEAFVAATAPAAAPQEDAGGFLLALLHADDHAGLVQRLGERGAEKLLLDLEAEIGRHCSEPGDAVDRSSGSPEYILVLHGNTARDRLQRILSEVGQAASVHGLRVVHGVAEAGPGAAIGDLVRRADADLVDRRAARRD